MKKLLFLLIIVCLQIHTGFAENPLRPGKDLALFIAVSEYAEWQDLRNPVTDAKAVAKELADNYGFATEVLENPSRNEIYATLEAYRNKEYAEDAQLFIFFSGHGDFREESLEGFFIPEDGKIKDPYQDTYIPHTRLERMVDNIPCKHIFLAIDACFSGTFDEAIALNRGPAFSRPGANQQDEVAQFVSRKLAYQSRLYLTSGGKERTPDGKVYSPYTERFLEGLRSYGGGDNLLTFTELLSFMEKAVPTPRSGSFGAHEPGGDFLFITSDTKIPVVIQEQSPKKEAETKQEEKIEVTKPDVKTNSRFGLVETEDGQTYKTVSIGNLTWLAENLNISSPRESWCYNGKAENCEQYGQLYTQSAAFKACKELGEGWHLPSDAEWQALIGTYGNLEDHGRSVFPTLLPGSKSGFEASFGGYLEYSSSYRYIGNLVGYFTSSVDRNKNPIVYLLSNSAGTITRLSASKSVKYSCRCVK